LLRRQRKHDFQHFGLRYAYQHFNIAAFIKYEEVIEE
jgi:hypothetical protein